jgi:hypothetical protein
MVKNIYLSYSVKTLTGFARSPIVQVAKAPSPGVKQPGPESDHLLPSSVEFKNARSSIFPLFYFFMAWGLIKHWVNCAPYHHLRKEECDSMEWIHPAHEAGSCEREFYKRRQICWLGEQPDTWLPREHSATWIYVYLSISALHCTSSIPRASALNRNPRLLFYL